MTEPIPARAWYQACAIGVLMTLAGFAHPLVPLRPCDAQAPAMTVARESDEHSIVVPVAAAEPALAFEPTEAPPGTPVKLLFTPPDGAHITVKGIKEWPFQIVAIDGNSWYVWPVLGENVAGLEVMWLAGDVIERRVLTATHHCGEPPPPKPLIELAGKDAPALAREYQARIETVRSTPISVARFWELHDFGLSRLGLSANPAVPVIVKRLEGVAPRDAELIDADAVAVELEKIVAELGKPPVVVTPVDPNNPATAATYVYEKDDTAVPVGVSTGLNRLNRERGVRATLFEEDTVDGDGDVPDQYKAALAAAQQAGLPALVVTTGDTILRVIPDPRTEQQVFEAIAP